KGSDIFNFTGGLNIPIGHVPLKGGSETLVFSIPNIYKAVDKDGDGKADEKSVLYGRFGNVDTHGMASSFTRWVDGWIYGTHGFSNTSKVKDASGNITEMNSGNTYRFKEDGSVFEQFTWGMVNPFGMTFDKWGNQFVSDCHSKPLYMMLRDAYYPSFGKPHNGLGYAPQMLKHNHGSTGICGPAMYEAEHFPAEFRGNVFICNPVNGKVNRDTLTQTGSTLIANEQPDFVTCEDPWFRPVDAIVGPDGALYIADFYNAIIGHYEVPLTHEKRDRNKGRIWRIVYTGDQESKPLLNQTDLSTKNLDQLIEALNSENLNLRVLATNHIVDRFSKESQTKIEATLSTGTELQKAHALWILERTAGLSDSQITVLMSAKEDLVRTHILKLVAERKDVSEPVLDKSREMLSDKNPFARRAAADVLGQHSNLKNVKALIDAGNAIDGADSHFHHVVRIALRKQFLDSAVLSKVNEVELNQNETALVAEILLSVKSKGAADYLLTQLNKVGKSPELFKKYLNHVIRYSEGDKLASLSALIQKQFSGDLKTQMDLLVHINKAMQQKGAKLDCGIKNWAVILAGGILSASDNKVGWYTDQGAVSQSKWATGKRKNPEGKSLNLISSFPKGESNTGVLKSDFFELPEKIEFYIAGHNGMNNKSGKNKVQLKDASGTVIKEVLVPGNDTARKVSWTFEGLSKQKVYLEVTDAMSENSYAWIALGEFYPAKLNINGNSDLSAALKLISSMKLVEMKDTVYEKLKSQGGSGVELLKTYATLANQTTISALVNFYIQNPSLSDIVKKLLKPDAAVFEEVASIASRKQLLDLVDVLANDKNGAEIILVLAEKKKLSAALINNPQVKEKIRQSGAQNAGERYDKIVSFIKTGSHELMADIKKREEFFKAAKTDLKKGETLFKTYCFACHSMNGQGGNVGPNLDGLGSRGFERIAEDILDPNLNVDPIFLTSTVKLKDGRTLIGMLRTPQGNTEIMVDSTGKESQISKSDIVEKKTSEISPMPAVFSQLLNEQDFTDLMAYLLSTKQK
ncbi:MAG: c-type cytochrome, partial [Lentisphaeraceae bacterium]|nr:c-type cytochrome [Lentisphaeraceae bacterium]